jgi:hypothetical protein
MWEVDGEDIIPPTPRLPLSASFVILTEVKIAMPNLWCIGEETTLLDGVLTCSSWNFRSISY